MGVFITIIAGIFLFGLIIYLIPDDKLNETLVWIIFFSIVALVICINIHADGNMKLVDEEYRYKPIVSLETDTSRTGSFVLGTGVINDDLVYFVNVKTGKDKYKLTKYYASYWELQESNLPPGIYDTIRYYKYGMFSKSEITGNWVIHVPYNTVRKEFKQ